MLKDEIEQKFVKALLKGGITHEQLEQIISADERLELIERLKPHIEKTADEAAALLRAA